MRMEYNYRTGPLPVSGEETMVNVGIDLHKTQFTTCVRIRTGDRYEQYPTTEEGYNRFLSKAADWQESGKEVRVGVESTGKH
jgi:hypothetical protein